MKTMTLASMTLFLLTGCNIEDPPPRLELSPMEIEQTADGPIFSFDEKVHDFDVWKCGGRCDESTFSDDRCGYDQNWLTWSSSVAEDRDFAKTTRDTEAPIAGPIVYGKKPDTAPHSSEPVRLLDDGYYIATATRYERACEDEGTPCWHITYMACNKFKVAGGAITTPLNAPTRQ